MAEAPAARVATLVYDADCHSCARFAKLVRRLDRRRRLEFAAMYDPATEARMRPKVGAGYDLSFHLVFEGDGRVESGERALEDLAKLLPATAALGVVWFRLPGVQGVPALIYRAFAAGRTCSADTARRVR